MNRLELIELIRVALKDTALHHYDNGDFTEPDETEAEDILKAIEKEYVLSPKTQTIEFSEGFWHNISGRGNVYSCRVPEPGFWSSDVYRNNVIIEGKIYFCTAIETHGKCRDHHAVKGYFYDSGDLVGLLIRGDI